MGCSDPAKAAELCTEWLTTRAAFLTETQRFTGLWLNFYSDVVKITWNGSAVTAIWVRLAKIRAELAGTFVAA